MSKKHTTIQNGRTHRSIQISAVEFQKEKMNIIFLVSFVVVHLIEWEI